MTALSNRVGVRTQGFTLLEILVALAVSAIVLLAIQTVFFGALRLQKTTTDAVNEQLSLERALAIVQRDLAGLLLPGSVFGGQLQSAPDASLSDDQLGDRVSPDFSTSSAKIDGYNPFSEVQVVAYFLAPAADGSARKTLIRSVTRNLLPAEAASSEAQPLLEGVTQANFTFFDGTEWTDTWDSTATATLPAAVKLSLMLASSSGLPTSTDPIEIVVPVLVSTQTSQAQLAAGGTP